MSLVASKLQGHARAMQDCELKQLLNEASHCIDTKNTWVVHGKRVRSARGSGRAMTLKEQLLWLLFKIVPVDAVASNR